MPTQSEQQRSELHKTIWSIADDLRGSVDGWDFIDISALNAEIARIAPREQELRGATDAIVTDLEGGAA